jgi:hypothetical protein
MTCTPTVKSRSTDTKHLDPRVPSTHDTELLTIAFRNISSAVASNAAAKPFPVFARLDVRRE